MVKMPHSVDTECNEEFMNDKDKEAFKEWYINKESEFDNCKETWQAACEYKEKEIDLIQYQLDYAAKIIIEVQADKCKIREENKKLREALEFYADATNNPKQYMRQGYLVYNLKKAIFVDGGTIAREAIKEIPIE
jgi:hypothetical protein